MNSFWLHFTLYFVPVDLNFYTVGKFWAVFFNIDMFFKLNQLNATP